MVTNTKEIVVVSGAGAAGISAAISAARIGRPVLLIERFNDIGGIVTRSLIHTLGGIFDSSGEFINEGIAIELTDRLSKADPFTKKRKIGRAWTLQCSPEIYEKVIEDWIREEPNIKLLRSSEICGIELSDKDIKSIPSVKSIMVKSTDTTFDIDIFALIDTTGGGEVIRLISPELVIDNEPKASGGLIFILRGINPEALNFPYNIQYVHCIRNAVKEGRLSAECAETWIDRGVYEGECYVKMSIDTNTPRFYGSKIESDTNIITTNKLRDELLTFLRTLLPFSKAYLYKTGILGLRDCGRVVGEYYLTGSDVTNNRKFDDAACRCSWPIEYWDSKKGVNLEYLRNSDYYEIPLRALKVYNLKNVWVAGKCFSGDSMARASARVVGCCWSMGEAVVKAVF